MQKLFMAGGSGSREGGTAKRTALYDVTLKPFSPAPTVRANHNPAAGHDLPCLFFHSLPGHRQGFLLAPPTLPLHCLEHTQHREASRHTQRVCLLSLHRASLPCVARSGARAEAPQIGSCGIAVREVYSAIPAQSALCGF